MKWISNLTVLFYFAIVVTGAQAGEIAKDGVLSVLEPIQSYEEDGDYKTISVVGKIKNHSSSYIYNVIIESQYFNGKGELIDAATEEQYSLIVPPNDTVAFSVSKQAIHKKSDYSSNKVRITYAEIKSSCNANKDNWLVKLLINWAPLIIIIAAWIFIFIRFQKKSPQAKTLALIEQQNELVRNNGEHFREFLEIVREYTNRNK
jgi:ATP-dependent Zn protease